MALDSYGNLHVSYIDENSGLIYAKSLFQLELINPWETFIVPGGTNNNRGKYSSIALDSNDLASPSSVGEKEASFAQKKLVSILLNMSFF